LVTGKLVSFVLAVTQKDIDEDYQRMQEQKLLHIDEILEITQGGSSSITAYAATIDKTPATATAMLLYSLAKRAERGVLPNEQQGVQEATRRLTHELIATAHHTPSDPSSDSQPESLLAQLSPKDFSLTAWSASKVRQKAQADVGPLCAAIMQHALQSNILADFGWADWSCILYGLTMAGITCKQSTELQQLYDQAIAVLTPDLAKHNPDRDGRSISSIIYAGARAGATNSAWKQYVAAITAGHAAGTAMVATSPRHWSTLVWACRILGVYDAAFLSTAASAILQQVEQTTAHDVSETLIALASLGWYEPAMYDALTRAVLDRARDAAPQSMCNVLYACCLAQHVTPAVQELADAALANRGFKQWVPQTTTNTLLACAVFALHVGDSARQTPVHRLSRILFETASADDPATYTKLDMRQLERAHHAAKERGLPCLDTQSRMFAAMQRVCGQDNQSLAKRQPLPLQHSVNRDVAATGRYTVVPPSIKDGWMLVQQEAQHRRHGHRIAVLALSQDSYLRHPVGKLTGPARLRLNILAALFPVVVVVNEHEWLALGSDRGAQVAHVDQLLQQAETAIAAVGGGARQQSGVADSQSSREPIIIGLPPQLHYHQQQDQQQPEDAAAPPPPPPPKLTPAEAEARLKALQQKQQTFFQGLPPPPKW
jgi:hypothetical protein